MGGAVLDTLRGDADASAVRARVMGTMLIYNGSIAFAITGLFLTPGKRRSVDLPLQAGFVGR